MTTGRGCAGCEDGLRGDDCFDGCRAVVASSSESVTIVDGKLEHDAVRAQTAGCVCIVDRHQDVRC